MNTEADAVNRLAVKSDAILFSHDDVTPGGGGVQVKINKATQNGTASCLFQTGFSARAEYGLAGDDNFRIKVSPDGASFIDSLVLDKDTGFCGENSGAPASLLDVNGTLTVRGNVAGAGNGFAYTIGADGAASVTAGGFIQIYGSAHGGAPRTLVFGSGHGEKARIVDGMVMVGAVGGDRGAGTINAQGVYDDNTLLSCYVFDQALDEKIDSAKWDSKVPDRVLPGSLRTPNDRAQALTASANRRLEVRRRPMDAAFLWKRQYRRRRL